MAIDISDCVLYVGSCGHDCAIHLQLYVISVQLNLHMWKTEMKITETEQAAFPFVTHAAAVALCPTRLGPASSSAHALRPII